MLLTLFGICLVVFAIYVYKKGYENADYFEKRNIKTTETFFAIGSFKDVFSGTSIIDYIVDTYNQFNKEKVYGLLNMRTPTLILRDLDLIQMTPLIIEIAEQLTTYLKSQCKPNEALECEMQEICQRSLTDIIAQCAYGLKVDSMKDKENNFYLTGKKIMDFALPANGWKFLVFRICPMLLRIFNVQFLDAKCKHFFKTMILKTMQFRQDNNIVRPDMINLLIEAKKGTIKRQEEDENDSIGIATVQESEIGLKSHKRTWNDDELVAQCFLFFQAGFETSSTLMYFAIYELTLNQDVQDKLWQEINEVHQNLAGKTITYEVLQKMKYMDMVVSETLRKWPPVPTTDRNCVKDLHFDDGKGFKYHFEKGTSIWIPITGIHLDEQYFSEPMKFHPERFSDENKDTWNHEAFMPFGIGPRACIGSRFALMEAKIMLYYLVLNFSFGIIQKTQIPIKLKPSFGGPLPENGVWVGVKQRV